MIAPLSELDCATIAANLNAETISNQQREIRRLEFEVARLRGAMHSIHKHCATMPGREAVDSLLERGYLRQEDVK